LVFNNFLVVNGDEIGLEKINEGGWNFKKKLFKKWYQTKQIATKRIGIKF
jgi:hypothetical protein